MDVIDLNNLNLDTVDSILIELEPKDLGRACKSNRLFRRSCNRREFRRIYSKRWYLDIRRFYVEAMFRPWDGLAYAIILPYGKERNSLIDYFLDFLNPLNEGEESYSYNGALIEAIKKKDLIMVAVLLPLVDKERLVTFCYEAGIVNSHSILNMIEEDSRIKDSDSANIWINFLQGLARGAHLDSFKEIIKNLPSIRDDITQDHWVVITSSCIIGFNQDRPQDSINLFNFIKKKTLEDSVDITSSTYSLWTSACICGRITAIDLLINQGIPFNSMIPIDIILSVMPLDSDLESVNFLIDKGGNPLSRIIGRLCFGDKRALQPYLDILHGDGEVILDRMIFGRLFKPNNPTLSIGNLELAEELLNNLTLDDLLKVIPNYNQLVFVGILSDTLISYQLDFLITLIERLIKIGLFDRSIEGIKDVEDVEGISIEDKFWKELNGSLIDLFPATPEYVVRVVLLLAGDPIHNKGVFPVNPSNSNNPNTIPISYYPPLYLFNIINHILTRVLSPDGGKVILSSQIIDKFNTILSSISLIL